MQTDFGVDAAEANFRLASARAAFTERDFARAELELIALRTELKNNDEVAALLARIAMQTSRWAEALQYWNEALTVAPEVIEYQSGAARALARLGQHAEADKIIEQLRAKFPTHTQTYRTEIECGEAKQDFQAVASAALRMLENDPESIDALDAIGRSELNTGRLSAAMQYFEKIRLIEKNDPRGAAGLARIAQRSGNMSESLRLWREVVEASPRHGYGWLGIAEACIQLHDYDEANKALGRAFESHGGMAHSLLALARLRAVIGDVEGALGLLARVRREFPAVRTGYILAGRLLVKAGEFREAADIFARARNLFPKEKAAYAGHAESLAILGDTVNLTRCLDDAELQFVETTDFKLSAARALQEHGVLDEAEALASAVKTDHPEDIRAWELIARIAEARRDWVRAFELWSKVVERFDATDALIGRARALRNMGEPIRARRELERVMTQDADDKTPAQTELAQLAYWQGDYAEASRLFESVLRKNPHLAWVRGLLACSIAANGDAEAATRVLFVGASPQHPALLHARLEIARLSENQVDVARAAIQILRRSTDRGLAGPMLIEALVGLGHEKLAQNLIDGQLVDISNPREIAICRFVLMYSTAKYSHALKALEDPNVGEIREQFLTWNLIRTLVRLGNMKDYIAQVKRIASPVKIGAGSARRRRQELMNFVQALEKRGEPPGDDEVDDYRRLLLSAHESLILSDFVKRAPTDERYAQFAKGVQERIAVPNALIEWVDSKLPEVRPHVRMGALIGVPLYYKHQALLEIDQPHRALECLRSALPYFFREPYFAARYRRLYRSLVDPLHLDDHQRILILILSCSKNLMAAQLLSRQIEKYTLFRALIVIADSTFDIPQKTDNVLTVPGDDTYEALPNKIARAYEYLALASNCQGVLKIDEDTYIDNFQQFSNKIVELEKSGYDYAGECGNFGDPTYHFGKCSIDDLNDKLALHGNVRYCFGKGYYLSRNALGLISQAVVRFPKYSQPPAYEDVMVGEILASFGIKPVYVSFEHGGSMYVDSFENIGYLVADETSECS